MSKLSDLITRHEGRKPHVYKDSLGLETIGIGRLLSRGLSDDEIELMFENDLREAENIVTYFARDKLHELSTVRQAVLTDMAFNLGSTRLNKFKKFRKAIQVGDMEEAALQMIDSKWYRQVKTRSKRLVKMWRTNKWSAD